MQTEWMAHKVPLHRVNVVAKPVSRLRKEKIFHKARATVLVRERSLLPPAGHIVELRLDLTFQSVQGHLFSAS